MDRKGLISIQLLYTQTVSRDVWLASHDNITNVHIASFKDHPQLAGKVESTKKLRTTQLCTLSKAVFLKLFLQRFTRSFFFLCTSPSFRPTQLGWADTSIAIFTLRLFRFGKFLTWGLRHQKIQLCVNSLFYLISQADKPTLRPHFSDPYSQ